MMKRIGGEHADGALEFRYGKVQGELVDTLSTWIPVGVGPYRIITHVRSGWHSRVVDFLSPSIYRPFWIAMLQRCSCDIREITTKAVS